MDFVQLLRNAFFDGSLRLGCNDKQAYVLLRTGSELFKANTGGQQSQAVKASAKNHQQC